MALPASTLTGIGTLGFSFSDSCSGRLEAQCLCSWLWYQPSMPGMPSPHTTKVLLPVSLPTLPLPTLDTWVGFVAVWCFKFIVLLGVSQHSESLHLTLTLHSTGLQIQPCFYPRIPFHQSFPKDACICVVQLKMRPCCCQMLLLLKRSSPPKKRGQRWLYSDCIIYIYIWTIQNHPKSSKTNHHRSPGTEIGATLNRPPVRLLRILLAALACCLDVRCQGCGPKLGVINGI